MLKCLLSPDVRQLATTSADKTIKLWNLDGFTLDRTLVGTAPHALQLAGVLCCSAQGWKLTGFMLGSVLASAWSCRSKSHCQQHFIFRPGLCLSSKMQGSPFCACCSVCLLISKVPVQVCMHRLNSAPGPCRPPAVGVGLRVFGGRRVPGHRVV